MMVIPAWGHCLFSLPEQAIIALLAEIACLNEKRACMLKRPPGPRQDHQRWEQANYGQQYGKQPVLGIC